MSQFRDKLLHMVLMQNGKTTPSGWAVDALRDFSSYGQLVNNVQPYIVIYFWRRTA